MDELSCYLPTDRLYAMLRRQELPDRTSGAALMADLSGFTALTELLVRELGAQRGSEEITRHINAIFADLIAEMDQFQGSVLIFGGDALTCWFDGDDGSAAVACALAMQVRMRAFSIQSSSGSQVHLAMKIAIVHGSARRFLVGDPNLQLFDVLAGQLLDRLGEAEHHAERGEVLLDAETAQALAAVVEVQEWRTAPETGQRYAVVSGLRQSVPAKPWPARPAGGIDNESLRPWLLPPVYERLSTGGGAFLAEIRPALPMFIRFTGIDYDNDPDACAKLDTFIRQVSQILARYEANILAVIMGDKGSHLYTAFGAPVAHEDEAARAASAALELRAMAFKLGFIETIQVGVSQGWIYAGASGGETRRMYVTMGSEVNLAARLMQNTPTDHIMISQRVRASIGDIFIGQELQPLRVKGRDDLISVYLLEGLRARDTIRLNEPRYALPMVGRSAELAQVAERMERGVQGHGQIVGITGEAGVGKSRLVAEVIHLANQRSLPIYGGECESYGTNTNYLVWRKIWRELFGIAHMENLNDQVQRLEQVLNQISPALTPRLPLLGTVLNLLIPDNDLTQSFDAKLRKTSLESLLSECLRGMAAAGPLVFILEDSHWMDDLSHDLLNVLGRAIANLPVLIFVSYRPPQMDRLKPLLVSHLPYFHEVQLGDFTTEETEQLIRLKLEQMTGSRENVPVELIERIQGRAGGNPFYIEELLNYVKDQQLDPRNILDLERLELPDSLYSLVLSRIDRISESQKVTLKVASVIGRMFRAAWIWGYYPQIGDPRLTLKNLTVLYQADLTPSVPSEPEETYLFKHILTQEVAYDSLPFTTRSRLHGLFGGFLERNYTDRLDRFIDLLAFHYDHSDQPEKRRVYLKKAGEFAQAQYANTAAIDFYQRLLPLVDGPEKVEVNLKLGQVLELTGRWNEAAQCFQQALDQAEQHGDQHTAAGCQVALGEVNRKQGRYAEASEWLSRAHQVYQVLGDEAGRARALHYTGTVAAHQGQFDQAKQHYEESLVIRRAIQDKPNIANTLNNLGNVAGTLGNLEEGRRLQEEALAIRRALGDRYAIGASLNNLGMVALDQEDYAQARSLLEEALASFRVVGDPWRTANALNNLGNAIRGQGSYPAASALYKESLNINHELDGKWSIAYLFEDIASLAACCEQAEQAAWLAGAASALRQAIGAPLSPAEQKKLDSFLDPARALLGEDRWQQAWQNGQQADVDQAVAYAIQSCTGMEHD